MGLALKLGTSLALLGTLGGGIAVTHSYFSEDKSVGGALRNRVITFLKTTKKMLQNEQKYLMPTRKKALPVLNLTQI